MDEAPNVNLIPEIKVRGLTIHDRYDYLYYANKDLGFRRDFNMLCAIERPFYISTCLWIFEPRGEGEFRDLPFLLRPFQEDFILQVWDAIENGYDLTIEKTREMGVTWGVLGLLNHAWRFERRFTAKIGSMTQAMIDKKDDEDSLFVKLDYLVESLKVDTPWLYPVGYAPKQPHRTFMKMKNPEMGGVITGQAPTARFGRGGRQRVIFMDEFQEWPAQESSFTSSSKTTDCRIIVGTPNGPHNLFARLNNPDKFKNDKTLLRHANIRRKKLSLHWMLDPTKNGYIIYDHKGREWRTGNGEAENVPYGYDVVYPWYEKQKGIFDFDMVKMAQEIDIDYNLSVQGQMYPMIRRARQIEKIDFNPALELYASIDFGVDDACAIGWFQYNQYTGRWIALDYHEVSGKSIKYFIPLILGRSPNIGLPEAENAEEYIKLVERHAGWEGYYTDIYGDPDGKKRERTTGTSAIRLLRNYGIYVTTRDDMRGDTVRYNATRFLIPIMDFNMEWCADFYSKIESARWQKERDAMTESASPRKPVHDRTSHARTMLEFLAVNNPYAVGQPDAPQNSESVTNEDVKLLSAFGDTRKLIALVNGSINDDRYEYDDDDRGGY